MDALIVILFSYLSGSIPFGLILTKIFGDQDGPRVGFFISFFGIKESIELINKYIK